MFLSPSLKNIKKQKIKSSWAWLQSYGSFQPTTFSPIVTQRFVCQSFIIKSYKIIMYETKLHMTCFNWHCSYKPDILNGT